MSQIHILNTLHRDEGVRCRRKSVRGAIDEIQFKQLVSSGEIRTAVKTRRLHSCDRREGDRCFKFKDEINCPARKKTVSAICKDCERRTGRK